MPGVTQYGATTVVTRPLSLMVRIVTYLLLSVLALFGPVSTGYATTTPPETTAGSVEVLPLTLLPTVADPAAQPAQDWLDQFGQQTVDALTGTHAPASFGTLRPIMTWSEDYLDGIDPQASPVPIGQWAAAISVDSKPIGIMVISQGSDDTWGGKIVDDPQLAGAAAASVRGSMLVHDPIADAWYMVTDTTVRAVGEKATTLLAGPVDLATYSAILHSRIEPQVLATQNGARTDTGAPKATPLWIPLMGVLVLIVVVAVATSRHERRVLALHEKE
ncbi:hypothetical protein [Actinomyces vulturis]|uniref:hypothetical protein n=1 Tax=Actinomyces vulturis TaxID=1857645 RepID=UPI000830DE9A|nr:hypothetical protein [Actinomyces vulturis]